MHKGKKVPLHSDPLPLMSWMNDPISLFVFSYASRLLSFREVLASWDSGLHGSVPSRIHFSPFLAQKVF